MSGPAWRARVRALLARWRRRLLTGAGPAELFPAPWPRSGPGVEDFAAALRRGGESAPRIPASAIHLVPLKPGVSGAQAVETLRREGWRARGDVPPWPLTPPIDWSADPHRDDNWRVQLNMLRLIDPLIHAHEESGDVQTLREAIDHGIAWHRFHLEPRNAHPWAWRDMMTGLRALRMAYLADRVRLGAVSVDASRHAALAAMLHRHWQKLVSRGFLRFTNHTIWDLHALEALTRLAMANEDRRRAAWQQAIGQRVDHLVDLQFSDDGLHRENSPQYHFVASTMFRVLQASGWYVATAPRLAAVLPRAAAMDGWMRLPDRRLLPIGDSDGSAPSAASLPVASAADGAGPTTTLNCGGYTMVRRQRSERDRHWSLLAVKAGIAPGGHLHHDLLSYLWSESGCDIVVDPGKYAYDNGPLRDYFRGNRAHNLIVFDERECDTRATPATRHLVGPLQTEAWGVRATARVRHHPVDVEHERSFCFAPGRWLVVIDRFAAGTEIGFEHLTHLAPEFVASCRDGGFEVQHADGSALRVATHATVPVEASVLSGVGGARPQGWTSRGYRRALPCPTLRLAGRARAGSVVLALSLDPRATLTVAADGTVDWLSDGTALSLQTGPLGEARMTASALVPTRGIFTAGSIP